MWDFASRPQFPFYHVSSRLAAILKFIYGSTQVSNIFYVDPAFGCWHHVEVGCVTDISEDHSASIIRAEVRKVEKVHFHIGLNTAPSPLLMAMTTGQFP
jgi:hypothetical protein